MPVIICMLRGVNVGGHNMIKMDALKALCVSLKLKDPQTYVQSGNVVFGSGEEDLPKLARRLQDAIEKAHGFRPGVVLRTAGELREVVARNPFAKRSGIAATMNTSGELDKAGFDVELAVFRILQEGLSNIHRHSQSSTATVLASCDGHILILEIADEGTGIPAGSAEGVGMGSMRERARLLKGELEIKTGPTGTTIIVRLPISDMASSKSTAA